MGTISEKLNYLNDTRLKIKDGLNKFGADLTENDTFRSYSNVLNDIYDKLPKVSGNGSNFTLENVQNGKLDLFEMEGNTHQDSYSGINLFDINAVTSVSNGTLGSDGVITTTAGTTENFNVAPYFPQQTLYSDKTYYLSADIRRVSGEGDFGKINDYVGDWQRVTAPTITNEFQRYVYKQTFTANRNYYRILFQFRNTNDGIFEIKNIMLSEVDDTYEPYVGGTPSPNPDYPQEIEVVENKQIVNVHGKNLLLYPYTQNTAEMYGVTFTVQNDGSVLVNGTASGGNANIKLYGNYQETNQLPFTGKYLFGGTNNVRLRALNNTNNNYTVLATDTGSGAEINMSTHKKGYIELTVLNGTTVNNEVIKPMVLDSLDDTTYEPYQSQDYEIDLGDIELCKIEDYKDSIKKSAGKNLFDKDNDVQLNTTANFNSTEDNIYTINQASSRSFAIVKVPSNSEITISTNNPKYSSTRYYIAYLKNKTTEAGKSTSWITNTGTFTTTSNTEYLGIVIDAKINGTAQASTQELINDMNIQIEQNPQATDYEPFGTDWYIKKEIGKVVLNGSEDGWNKGSSATTRSVYSNNTFTDRLSSTSQKDFVSDKFSYLGNAQITDLGYAMSFNSQYNSRYLYIQVPLNVVAYDHLDDFKTWLSTHNTTVYYILNTPTTEEITDSTLISQLEAIETETGTNIFEVSNENNVLPSLNVKRLKDLEKLS